MNTCDLLISHLQENGLNLQGKGHQGRNIVWIGESLINQFLKYSQLPRYSQSPNNFCTAAGKYILLDWIILTTNILIEGL